MTRNEKIAEKMGWIKYFGDEPVITDSGHKVSFQFIRTPDGDIDFDLKIDTQTAHLLIERMVADGWDAEITISKSGVMATETKWRFYRPSIKEWLEFTCTKPMIIPDFPAAVVELFCKVYSIDGSADHSDEMEHRED